MTASPTSLSNRDLWGACGFSLEWLMRNVSALPSALEERRLSAEQITFRDDGMLCWGEGEFAVADAAWENIAAFLGLSGTVFKSLDCLERVFVIGHRHTRFPTALRLLLKRCQVKAIGDARIEQASAADVVCALNGSLPVGLDADQVQVANFGDSDTTVDAKLFSSHVRAASQSGDVLHGGLAITLSLTGQFATRVYCLTRREACGSFTLSHICAEGSQRTRRAPAGPDQRQKQLAQIRRACRAAWAQAGHRLEELCRLREVEGDPAHLLKAFLDRSRRRLSINNQTADAMRVQLRAQQNPTGSAYDVMLAISYVATHRRDGCGSAIEQLGHAATFTAVRRVA